MIMIPGSSSPYRDDSKKIDISHAKTTENGENYDKFFLSMGKKIF